SEAVEIHFAQDRFLLKDNPHRTILSVVKGTTLAALYRKERERLFAYNIRSFLGKRVNKPIIETAIKRPEEFYYFNNGVSAVCTHIHDLGNNKFRFDNFQIINGAQTVGSLAQIASLDSKCEVVLRITEGISVKTEKGFNADIILYNNTQNVVRASDFRSNDSIQLWLEDRFSRTKARGAVTEPLRYVRKRSHKRVRGAWPVKFEELAKIRYAYFYEPTQCVADPRSLWTAKEDGGFYERAFGIDGELRDIWTDDEFDETLFAIVTFFSIMYKIKLHIKQDKANYFFLQRLRFWALSLAHLHIRAKKIHFEELLASEKKFEDWFAGFWRDIFRDLVQAFKAAQESKISNFALARNETRWNTTKETVELVLRADLG
ncbi:MAG: AIPR family protein, partial [Polynucleobacter sp.]|nr:AIPR family protein [Polynucleobacter sp.]